MRKGLTAVTHLSLGAPSPQRTVIRLAFRPIPAELPSAAVLGGREAVPPKPVLPTGGVDLKKQASAVRDPVALRPLWQSANFLVG